MRAGMALLVVVGAVGAARAEEPLGPGSPESAADVVVAAFDADDAAALSALAVASEPDPWHVAHVLCTRERFDAATGFAKASKAPAVGRLAAYVASRKDAEGAAAAAIRDACAQLQSQDGAGSPPPDALKDGYLRARLLFVRARVLVTMSGANSPADAYEAGAAAAAAVGWLDGAALGYTKAGFFHLGTADYRAARESWRPLLEIHRLRADPVHVATITKDIANLSVELRELATAIDWCDRAIALYGKLDDRQAPRRHLLIAYLRAVAATMRVELGEFARALTDLDAARSFHEKSGNKPFLAMTETFLGAAHQRIGNYEEALLHHENALALHTESKDAHGRAVALANVGAVSEKTGDIPRARRSLEEARALYEEQGRKSDLVRMRHALARVAWKDGRREQAVLALTGIVEELEGAVRFVGAATTLGKWFVELGRFDEADAVLARALERAEEAGLTRELFGVHVILTRLAYSQGDAAAAVVRADDALRILDEVSASLSYDRTARARAKSAGVFDDATAAAAALGDVARVSEFVERSRSGALAGAIAQPVRSSGGKGDAAVTAELQAAQRAEATAGAAYRRALGSRSIAEVQRAQAAYDAAREELRRVTQRIERDGRLALSLGIVQPVALARVEALLRDGDVLVRYALLDDASLAVVSQRMGGKSTTRVVRLAPAADIRALCATGSYRSDEGSWNDDAARLRAAVVDPLGLPSSARRVLVVPDGELNRVPFALLVGQRDVGYAPSATVLSLVTPTGTVRGKRTLALGDPDYAGSEDLYPLPHTRAEAERTGDVVLVGGDASETRLVEALRADTRWRTVHLACHGLLDEEHPMRTALALTPTETDDGMLTVLDVLRLRVDADLVVLSACDTGRGRIVDGEGVVGLAQSFMAAGAPRVIVSLWMVDDAATAALMKRFHEIWRGGGSSAAAALRKAQEHVAGREKWRHPRFWAGWTLWGNPD